MKKTKKAQKELIHSQPITSELTDPKGYNKDMSLIQNFSASKTVFIMLMGTACAGFLWKILPVDQFMILAIAASSFYFSKPVASTATNEELNAGMAKK